MQRQRGSCHELTGNCLCIMSARLRESKQEHAARYQHPGLCFQRFFCLWIKWPMKNSTQGWRVIPLQFNLSFSSGEIVRFALSFFCLEWAAICALFRKEKNITNCCTKFPRWVQALLSAIKTARLCVLSERC